MVVMVLQQVEYCTVIWLNSVGLDDGRICKFTGWPGVSVPWLPDFDTCLMTAKNEFSLR